MARLETLAPAALPFTLPVTLDQRASPMSTVVTTLLTATSAAILFAPFGLLAAHAAIHPTAFGIAFSQPATALQLCLALLMAVGFVALPVRTLLMRARNPRRIVVASDHVSASGGAACDRIAWREPLSAYTGVAHHIRSTLSGTEHEIVLVHRVRSRCVVLHRAVGIAEPQLDAAARLLGVPRIPVRAMYERSWPPAAPASRAA